LILQIIFGSIFNIYNGTPILCSTHHGLRDFWNCICESSVHDVTNDGGSVFFAMVLIFTKKQNYFVCAALITISGNSCTIYRKFFSGEVEVVSCSYIAGMLLRLLC